MSKSASDATIVVSDKSFFHVSVATDYKKTLQLNQQVRTVEDNPFFAYYERALQLGVSEGGRIVQINAVDWIHRVKRGTISTTYEFLAGIARDVTQHYLMLSRELLMEQIRLEEFGGVPPSRQKCLFLSETIEEAKNWLPLVGQNGLVCELKCTGVILRADSRLMPMRSEPLSLTRERARKYWRGESSPEPRHETLFVGEATVVTVDLK